MNIDRINISNPGINRKQASQANELALNADKDRQVSKGSDSVALSSKAKELEQLASTIEQSRTERFNEVREALESGTYQVPAKAVAQKLIDGNKK